MARECGLPKIEQKSGNNKTLLEEWLFGALSVYGKVPAL